MCEHCARAHTIATYFTATEFAAASSAKCKDRGGRTLRLCCFDVAADAAGAAAPTTQSKRVVCAARYAFNFSQCPNSPGGENFVDRRGKDLNNEFNKLDFGLKNRVETYSKAQLTEFSPAPRESGAVGGPGCTVTLA